MLLRSIGKSNLLNDQTLTVSLRIVNEMGHLDEAGLSGNTKACLHIRRQALYRTTAAKNESYDSAMAVFSTFEA